MSNFHRAGKLQDIALGKEQIALGKVGTIVLAGGSGSRLGWQGPKGTYPISLVKKKSLFALLFDRVLALSEQVGRKLPLAVMVSPANRKQTEEILPDWVDRFEQSELPLLDLAGAPLKEKGPDGNGGVLCAFFQSGLYDLWKRQGVEYFQVIVIDNPLAEPFDPNQIGIQYRTGAEVSLKVVKRLPDEHVGVVGWTENGVRVVEYCEDPPEQWQLASTSLWGFSLPFVEMCKQLELPLHTVKKGDVYKRERFIFDLLESAKQVEVILYEREEVFVPLKERKDVSLVQKALLARDQRVFERVTGSVASLDFFELGPSFHFPSQAFQEKWKGRPHPGIPYLEG